LAYRDGNGKTRNARYMVTRNLSGNFFSFDLDVYAKYEPVVVVGIDYESNLFRVQPFLYFTRRQYSWKKYEPTGMSVRPLGAFLYFRKPPPKELTPKFGLIASLKLESITFTPKNPLASLEGLSPSLKSTLTSGDGGCIYCHKLGGVGGRMHHLAAIGASPQPGYALPLRSYSRDVMHNFLYDQERVARMFGVTPNFVSAAQAKELAEFLSEPN
ncbi:MAG: hypothetical protein VX871_03990, partial [Pseudomonadota bacterium]|nr:hypothetical protein [Pseudomonadota bacterium]